MSNTNIADVQAWLTGWLDGFNFKRVGKDQSLGRDIAMKVVEQIRNRALTDKKGTGEVWPDNEPNYAAYKEKRYQVADAPNQRTGQMLSQLSLYGRTTIEPQLVTMKYGLDQPPTQTNTGVPLAKADEKRTDVQKAYYAHTGQSRKKVLRPFYEVDESDAQAVVELCQDNLNKYIIETNAKNGY